MELRAKDCVVKTAGLYRKCKLGKGSLASGLGRLRIGGGVRMCLEESPALSDTCPGFLWDLIVIRYYVECFSNFPSP